MIFLRIICSFLPFAGAIAVPPTQRRPALLEPPQPPREPSRNGSTSARERGSRQPPSPLDDPRVRQIRQPILGSPTRQSQPPQMAPSQQRQRQSPGTAYSQGALRTPPRSQEKPGYGSVSSRPVGAPASGQQLQQAPAQRPVPSQGPTGRPPLSSPRYPAPRGSVPSGLSRQSPELSPGTPSSASQRPRMPGVRRNVFDPPQEPPPRPRQVPRPQAPGNPSQGTQARPPLQPSAEARRRPNAPMPARQPGSHGAGMNLGYKARMSRTPAALAPPPMRRAEPPIPPPDRLGGPPGKARPPPMAPPSVCALCLLSLIGPAC